ncbi:Gfo/Idh/MocA family oxidoreductase [Paenibacillus rhizovicinus]|uniref:Gfo/Idh/MocA family oxidoreductase n=1 Tax=Paenibacillus rhizovicinus TaxID=2704463 RepID=A0A6C0P568_9BACL|nr:Gfo/Idh/MocA family oxidoreductase [Paenibacillus rhizovicinus]QHW33694.1 Gfo/Idh/MocA family oxidoreductase [Paenibacillus rhizovicinus]
MSKVRVGFVGAGGIASAHMEALVRNEKVQLTAVCDVVQASAHRAAEKYGMQAYSDFDSLLDAEEVDALFVCVPPFAHGDIEEKACAKGIHLFVEKPLGLDMNVIRKKAAIIRDAGIMSSSGYVLRYLDTASKARAYLQGKTIGMVRAHYMTGFVSTPWWRDMAKSGGQLVEQTTHTVDMVRFLAGDVSKVYAQMALRVMGDIENLNIPDVGTVALTFESGAIGHVDTCFIQPDHRVGVEVQGKDFRVLVEGSKLTITDKEGTQTVNSETEDIMFAQDSAFIDAVITGNRSLILAPYDDALRTVEITLAANQSALSGNPVQLGEGA